MKTNMPQLQRVLETSLYVDDMERSIRFYQKVMQLEPIHQNDRLCAFSVGGHNVLLIFQRGSTLHPIDTAGGIIPSHNGHGPLHMAFAISKDELSAWETRLINHNVAILSQVKWPRGGISIYFHDPDEHLIELATPGVWSIY
jgi:catechol 2,3-dioxygenase-like lactoylglutathione lyase family enzyme